MKLGAAAALALASSGCVAWHSGTAVTDAHAVANPSKIDLEVGFQVWIPDVLELNEDQRNTAADIARDHVVGYGREVFHEAPRYELTSRDQADYILKVDVVDYGGLNANKWLSLACGVTLTVIPFVGDEDYRIDAQLVSRSGRSLGTHSIIEKQTNVMELLMLLGMPFAGPRRAQMALWHDVFTDLKAWSSQTIARDAASRSQA
jgi:hypothetical protein